MLPGGGIEPGEDPDTALARELREEIAATAEVHSLVLILQQDTARQYIYLARPHTWSASPRRPHRPRVNDPGRGSYHLQPVPLTTQALASANLKPAELAQFLLSHISASADLFALPDLRAGHDTAPFAGRHSHVARCLPNDL